MNSSEPVEFHSLISQLAILNNQFYELYSSKQRIDEVIKVHDARIKKLKDKIKCLHRILEKKISKSKTRKSMLKNRVSISHVKLFSNKFFLFIHSIDICQYRHNKFWEDEVKNYTDLDFKENFRLKRESFEYLKTKIAPYFQHRKVQINYKEFISLEKKLAIFLYVVGSLSENRSVATLFEIKENTVDKIIIEIAEAIWVTLKDEYMKTYPLTREKLNELIEGFEKLGFPQCCGCIGKYFIFKY